MPPSSAARRSRWIAYGYLALIVLLFNISLHAAAAKYRLAPAMTPWERTFAYPWHTASGVAAVVAGIVLVPRFEHHLARSLQSHNEDLEP